MNTALKHTIIAMATAALNHTPRTHEIDCDLDEDCTCGAAEREEQLLLSTIFADDTEPELTMDLTGASGPG